jgi:hypothetical protein
MISLVLILFLTSFMAFKADYERSIRFALNAPNFNGLGDVPVAYGTHGRAKDCLNFFERVEKLSLLLCRENNMRF